MPAPPPYTANPRRDLSASPAFGPVCRAATEPDDNQRRLGWQRRGRGVHRVPPPPSQASTGRARGSTNHGGRIRPDLAGGLCRALRGGFELSVSNFFRRFLTHFGLQPHHFAANVILQVAAFVSLCEVYLGIEPHLDLFHWLFFFKQMTMVKIWQKGFFYVKNVDLALGLINPPNFINTPPVAMQNLKSSLPHPIEEVDQLCTWLAQLTDSEGLNGVDLLTTDDELMDNTSRPLLVTPSGKLRRSQQQISLTGDFYVHKKATTRASGTLGKITPMAATEAGGSIEKERTMWAELELVKKALV
ncbi:hypothetical protein D1007_27913 [Hordeum vulgare]|nr:hypothetical protein D1007_27913 [Hordeum vulgare]